MDSSLIETYGYWAVFVGMLIEGEIILLLAGYMISRGYLDPMPTLLVGAAGGTTVDFAYFWLGRLYGQTIIRRFAALRRVRSRAVLFLRRFGRPAAFVVRFAYGLRIVSLLTMGSARLRPAVFLGFNGLGAVAFAVVWLSLGYLSGETLRELLGRLGEYEHWIIPGLILLGVLILAVRQWRLYHAPDTQER